MNNLKELINNLNIKFELSKEIRKGETANTYLGNYQNKKSILKLFKKNHNKLITNQYLDNEINNQLINKNLFPEIYYINKKIGVLIYKYFDGIQLNKKSFKNINLIARKLKTLHSIDCHKKNKSLEDQFISYKEILKSHSKIDLINEGWKHFLNIKDKSDEQVFSHNDLNKTNILSDNVNIVFIDFEYSSMNSRYCDIARIIESFSFNDNETETFLELYGMEANSNIIKSIDEWSLANTYIDLIWAYIVDKLYPGAIENSYIVNLEAKLDNKSYKYSNN
jgi:thiamine kinase-like enzyme